TSAVNNKILHVTHHSPILTKPRIGRAGRVVLVHKHKGQLPDVISADRVYQEFLPGEKYDANLFAKPQGNTVAVVLRKTALKEGIVGNALEVERVEEKEVAEQIGRASCRERGWGWEGGGGVEDQGESRVVIEE